MFLIDKINKNMFKDVNTIYSRLKSSAKKRNIPFHLKLTDIDQIGCPMNCPVLGIRLNYNAREQEDDSPSFDRIDSTKPYSIDNVVIISWKANRLKSNATLKELKMIVEFLDNHPDGCYSNE